jgi:hypothetical protein
VPSPLNAHYIHSRPHIHGSSMVRNSSLPVPRQKVIG